jgi:hypothetical protein
MKVSAYLRHFFAVSATSVCGSYGITEEVAAAAIIAASAEPRFLHNTFSDILISTIDYSQP